MLLAPGLLKSQLQLLETQLLPQQHQLVLSVKELSEYYSHELATCRVNAKTRLINLILHVPVKKQGQVYDLYQAIAIPFQRAPHEICRLQHDYSTDVLVNHEKPVVVEGGQSRLCNFDSHTCHFDEFGFDPSPSALCAMALIKGVPVKELESTCAFDCRLMPPDNIITASKVLSLVQSVYLRQPYPC